MGGRNVVPNVHRVPCESRSATTCRRDPRLGRGVRLHAGIYGVLNGLGIIMPSGSRVVGVQWWSHRWVSGIVGVDQAGVRVGKRT